MKKLICILLVLCLCIGSCLAFAACGKEPAENPQTPDEEETVLTARKLASVSDLWQDLTGLGFPQASLFVKKSLVESQPQTVRAFASAVAQSIAYLNASAENALELGNYMQETGLSTLKGAVVSKCYKDMRQEYKSADEVKEDVASLVGVLQPALANADISGVFYTASDATADSNGTALTVRTPDGAPAMALAYMMKNTATLDGHALKYEIIAGEDVKANLINQNDAGADFIIAPTNAGVALSKQKGQYQLLATTSWGNLFLLSTDPAIKTLAECNDDATAFLKQFAGRSISSIGNGQVPDLTLNHLLTLANVDTVEVVAAETATIIQADLVAGRITNALLGEPAVTGTIALVAAQNNK